MYARSVAVAVFAAFVAAGCSAPRSSAVEPLPAIRRGSIPAGTYIDEQQKYLATRTLADGAILYTKTSIEPYYANLAATGELAQPSKKATAVRRWMKWYVAHLNGRDRWGLHFTMYDYKFDGKTGVETSTNDCDSVDSYATTFFTLARALYDATPGDGETRQLLNRIRPQFEGMAATIEAIQQRDGMTIAKPNYPVAYVMDNSEVYRGLVDLSYLEQRAFGRGSMAKRYADDAGRVAAGIATLWNDPRGSYDEEKQEPHGPKTASKWSRWYPDATAQLFPALQGVLPPGSARAKALYAAFNANWPNWDELQFPDQFPWALVAAAAAVQGDTARVERYAQSIEQKYSPGFPWPWYDLESGWYLRALDSLQP